MCTIGQPSLCKYSKTSDSSPHQIHCSPTSYYIIYLNVLICSESLVITAQLVPVYVIMSLKSLHDIRNDGVLYLPQGALLQRASNYSCLQILLQLGEFSRVHLHADGLWLLPALHFGSHTSQWARVSKANFSRMQSKHGTQTAPAYTYMTIVDRMLTAQIGCNTLA